MSDDVLDWLKAQRDRHAVLRDEAFQNDDWHEGNPHDDSCKRLYEAIVEIEKNREIIEVMKNVLMRRIIEGYGKT
jgi:DNA polymerase II large subunit